MENSFSRNSLITLLAEILIFASGFFSLIILARVLGPTGKGIFSLIILIPGIMLTFGSFGLESANIYFIGSRRHKVQDIASNSLALSFIIGFILILIFFAISQFSFFQRFINSNQIPHLCLWLAILVIPISLLSNFFRNILRGKGEIIQYNKIRILENFIQLVAIIAFLLVAKQGVFGATLSFIIAVLAAGIISIFFLKKITKLYFLFNKKLFKESIMYGGKVYLANAISFLNYRLDMLLIALFLAPTAVGTYSIAVGMSEKLFMIPGALAVVLFPKVASLSHIEADDLTPRVVRHTLFIMIIISLLLAISSAFLIKALFGEAFLPAVSPLLILLPGIIAFGIGGVLAADLGGRGKPEFAIYSSLACLIANISLNIILIPKWGISGSALASTLSYWIDTAIIIIFFLKISKSSLSEILLIKAKDFKDYLQVLSILKSWIHLKNKNI